MQEWWQNPDVDLVQFMGKDNVPFHTIIFPASQIGTRQEWTKMKNISVTEYLNYEGVKFSKTNSVGVFGNDAKDTGIPVEVWSPVKSMETMLSPSASDCASVHFTCRSHE